METTREETQKLISKAPAAVGNVDGSGSDDVSLLISLSQTDPLFEKKKKLLHARGFGSEVRVFLSSFNSPNLTLKVLVEAARIMHLDEDELYFAGVDSFQPLKIYSPRNELVSLNSIISLIDSSLKSATYKELDTLQALRDATIDMIREFGDRNREELIIEKCTCHAEDLLLQWGKDHDLKTKLRIAHIEGAGRGAVAVEDLEVGDTAVEIPESVIISEDLIYESDLFHILKNLDSITPETGLLLWSMKERYNPESKYKIYFETLPETFKTGLSFGIEALAALEGTLLFEEIIQAKEHLRMQYDGLCPALCSNHPDIFQPDLYTWDRFLWACELWYSNSMKVMFADGKLKTCLVPIAGLLNHSICPHILDYGRVDSATRCLKFVLSRPCKQGEECYLSYGKFSTSHLITFYGFLPRGENPYDVIPLDIEENEENGESAHMVRGTWLSSNHDYGLPAPLLNLLRAALNDSKRNTSENEMAVLETLRSIFIPMLEGLGVPENIQRHSLDWDVKLALDFKDLQTRIVSSVLASSSAGLEMLQQ